VRQAMMSPSSMSFFDLLQFFALFVCEIDSHLPVRLGHRLMNAPGRVSPNVSELGGCFVNDRRNFGDLFWRQVKLGAESFLHSPADKFRTVKRKEMMPGVHPSKERATDSPGDKHQDESRNEFPLQRAVHFTNSSWIAESAMANSFVKDSLISRL
jgi:hypothetical protein